MKKISAFSMILAFFVFVFCPVVQAGETKQEKIEIRDGIIYFPEQDVPEINLSKLNFNVPDDAPKEIKDLQGKIYRGESTSARDRTKFKKVEYLILMSYDSSNKEIKFFYSFAAGKKGKPGRDVLKGTYMPGGSTVLERGRGNEQLDQQYRLEILGDKLRTNASNGWGADYSPVAKLP